MHSGAALAASIKVHVWQDPRHLEVRELEALGGTGTADATDHRSYQHAPARPCMSVVMQSSGREPDAPHYADCSVASRMQ